MIEFLKGSLIEIAPNHVVVCVNGVGYRLLTPTSLMSTLPPPGSEVTLYSTFIVRENAFTLFGFANPQDKQLFEVLVSISGIGPKTALALVSSLSYQDLIEAVQEGNSALICKTPGIGKKTAERLILEVKDKVPGLAQNMRPSSSLISKIDKLSVPVHLIRDAMSALINLGYNQVSAEKAITGVISDSDEDLDLPQLISKALKKV